MFLNGKKNNIFEFDFLKASWISILSFKKLPFFKLQYVWVFFCYEYNKIFKYDWMIFKVISFFFLELGSDCRSKKLPTGKHPSSKIRKYRTDILGGKAPSLLRTTGKLDIIVKVNSVIWVIVKVNKSFFYNSSPNQVHLKKNF